MGDDTERVLRDLVGSCARIEQAIKNQGDRLTEHMTEDQHKFDLARAEFTQLRDSMTTQLEAQDVSRNRRLDGQDGKLNTIQGIVERLKGAWWMLIVIATVVSGVITTVIAWMRSSVHN